MLETISVIIPCYNSGAAKLTRSLRSVLAQSWESIDILVVDDGSDEAFSGVNTTSELNDERVRWLRLRKNKGVASARNAAASVAIGDYFAFLDAGDWWHKDKLFEQIKALESACNVGLVYCSTLVHRRRGDLLLEAKVMESAYDCLLVGQPITGSASSVLMPARVFRELGGFFDEYDIPEDRDLWLRVAEKYKVIPVARILVHLETDSSGRSADPAVKLITYRKFLDRQEVRIKAAGRWHQAMVNLHRGIAVKFLKRGAFIPFAGHAFSAAAHHAFAYLERLRSL